LNDPDTSRSTPPVVAKIKAQWRGGLIVIGLFERRHWQRESESGGSDLGGNFTGPKFWTCADL